MRNVCITAHVDHGKTTLADALLAQAHALNASKAGTARALDTDAEEQERGITIKSTGIELRYPTWKARNLVNPDHEGSLVLGLIDCPGHVDFSGEVTAALRISDGTLVVVDCIEGIGVQTQTVLRQALTERTQPVLFLNKVDRVIKELQLTPEEAYQRLAATIAKVNELIDMYQPEDCDFLVDPAKGTVGFGSGLYGWGFTLETAAKRLVAEKQGVEPAQVSHTDPLVSKVTKMLWGEYFVEPETARWKKASAATQGWERTFCSVVLAPIYSVYQAEAEGSIPDMEALCKTANYVLKPGVWDNLTLKDVRKKLLQHWMPVSTAMLTLIDLHLPCPLEAQSHRLANIYQGPIDDSACQAMEACDALGPVMVYVSKMVPLGTSAKSMLAFGRVFSGTLKPGAKVYVLDPDYTPPSIEEGEAADAAASASSALTTVVVKGTYTLMADKRVSIESARAGQLVAMSGLDRAIIKSATVTDSTTSYPLKTLKFSVSPVVRVSIRAEREALNSKLLQAMNALKQTDPTVQCFVDKATNEKILAGVGELHVEVSIHALSDAIGCKVLAEEPSVQYCETVTTTSPVCMAKSRNKHNRLLLTAEPLDETIVDLLDAGTVSNAQDSVKRAQLLAECGLDRNRTRKIVHIHGTNIILDETVGLDITPLRDMIVTVFQEVCEASVVAREPLRGVLFSITDARLHSDSVHRRGDQIMPMTRRALFGAILSASPQLVQPIFEVNIQAPQSVLAATRKVLKNRQGSIVEDIASVGTPIHHVKAHLPVAQSFGFSGDLMGATSGKAFPNVTFSHWSAMDEDPLVPGYALVQSIRTRKRLAKVEVPLASDLLDKA
eukprot:m.117766 g.117766  ORF g.117766 m.117766 type:complete len:837 (+) comp13637_c0_seq1:441-2951(+)